MVIGAPMTGEDLEAMMELAKDYDGPIALRYPRGKVENRLVTPEDNGLVIGKGVCLRAGERMAVLSIGAIGNTVAEAIDSLEDTALQDGKRIAGRLEGYRVAHYDMRWLKPIDEALLHEVGKHYDTIVTVEDGMISGGLGSAVLEFMADNSYSPHIVRLGVDNQFVEHGSTKELYHLLKLDKRGICESLLQALEQ